MHNKRKTLKLYYVKTSFWMIIIKVILILIIWYLKYCINIKIVWENNITLFDYILQLLAK